MSMELNLALLQAQQGQRRMFEEFTDAELATMGRAAQARAERRARRVARAKGVLLLVRQPLAALTPRSGARRATADLPG